MTTLDLSPSSEKTYVEKLYNIIGIGFIILFSASMILIMTVGVLTLLYSPVIFSAIIYCEFANHCPCDDFYSWKCQKIGFIGYGCLIALIIIITAPFVCCFGTAYLMDFYKKKNNKGTDYKKEELYGDTPRE